MEVSPQHGTVSTLLALASVALVGCIGSGSSSGSDDSDTSSGPGDTPSAPQTENFSVAMAQMQPITVGEAGEVLLNSVGSNLHIGPAGHVVSSLTLRDAKNFDLLSQSRTAVMVDPEGNLTPYLSRFIDLPGSIGGDFYGSSAPTRHAPDADGAIRALITVERADSSKEEVALKYHDGQYQWLFGGDDLPAGLEDYTLNTETQSWQGFVTNPSGKSAIRLNMTDSQGSTTSAWLRGLEGTFEPLVKWGESTGVYSAKFDTDYEFKWPFISASHLYPSIDPVGTIRFFASSKTDRDQHPEEEFSSLRGIWKIPAGESDVQPSISARREFVDQTTGQTAELHDIEPAWRVHSPNAHGDTTILNYNDSHNYELWLKRDGDFFSIARQGVVAPNLADVGIASGATFGRIGNASLSNNGTFTFHAEVEAKRSVWLSDGDDLWPVAIQGMSAPGLEDTVFKDLGLGQIERVPPLINNRDQIVFRAGLHNTVEDNEFESLWFHDPCNGLNLITAEGHALELDGLPELVDWADGDPVIDNVGTRERTIHRIETPSFTSNGRAYGPNAGLPYPLTDDGLLVFPLLLDGELARTQVSEGDTGTFYRQSVAVLYQLPECQL